MKPLLPTLTIIRPLQRWLGGFVLVALFQISILTFAGNNLEFIANKGQIIDMEGNLRLDILYVGDGGGAKIYLREGGVSYVMSEVEGLEEIKELEEEIEHEKDEIEKKKKQEKLAALEANAKLKVHRVDMEFVNANIASLSSFSNVSVRVEEVTQGYFNYYLGHCPEGITGVKAHQKVIYENMYPNIDVVFYGGKEKGMEYDFVVKSGGNTENIKLRYKGTDGMEVEEGQPTAFHPKGEKLKIKTSLGDIIEEIPEVYQIIDGERVAIEAAYKLVDNEVKIIVGDYDKSKELIIDPWITYYGGSNDEWGHGTAADGSGNVVITGRTNSINFPVLGAFQTGNAGGYDAFVVKFDSMGNRLWATYYGGTNNDYGYGIATDDGDNILITGYTTSTDFPVAGAFQANYGGGLYDAFVVKFDAAGSQLWATYYGGNVGEIGYGIATDNNSNVLITGWTGSANFPVSPGAFQTIYGGGLILKGDAFIVKFDAGGNRLWATFYGGSVLIGDEGHSIATDDSGNVVITGQTGSADFPVTPGAFQTTHAGGSYDAFVVKLDSAGNQLWATFYGGAVKDEGYGIATDGSGNVVITGITLSTDFPVTTGAFQTGYAGGSDAFVVKFDAAGNQLWGTYLGGTDTEEGFGGVAVDGSDNIYVCGDTYSADFPGATPTGFQPAFGGDEDNYMVKFDPNGDLACGTYLGGSGHDEMWYAANNIAVYGGVVYMAGWNMLGNYPVTAGAYQTTSGGGIDAWIAQFCDDCTLICFPPLIINGSAVPNTICEDSCTNLGASAVGGTGTYTFSWTSIPTGFTSSTQNPGIICPGTTTTYIVTVDDGATTETDSVTVVVLPAPIVDLGADQSICLGANVTLDAGNSGASYQWSTGENTQAITVDAVDIYWVEVNDGGCMGSDTININVEVCDTTEPVFFIPNSFSPNDDGDNNILFIRGSGIKSIKLFIYNRWGEKVFETNNISEGWNGTYKNKKLNAGVFSWYAEVEFEDGNNPGQIYQKGNVTLVR